MIKDSLIFATTNEGKIREAKDILNVDIISEKIELDEIRSLSFDEVISHKAKQAYLKIGKPGLVEDSGIVFSALGMMPGVFTKWFLKSMDLDNFVKLCEISGNYSALAVSYFGLYDGIEVKIEVGTLKGLSVAPRGLNGFGWDPIFQPDGHIQTFGDMDERTKNSVSMSKSALLDLMAKF